MTADDSPLEFDSEGPDKRAIAVTNAETRLLDAVKDGEFAVISGAPKPDQTDGWQDDHTVRAAFLRHLCLHPDRYEIDPRGVQLIGARITGTLDLEAATLHRPLWITDSRFESAPNLRDATTRTFSLQDCHLPGLLADRLTVTGTLRFDRSTFSGGVRLGGATLSSSLDCTKATFDNADGFAFIANGLTCGGNVIFDNVIATGETHLLAAKITGDLDCEQATFNHPDGGAFSAERMSVQGRFYWRALARPPQGTVNFMHARVGDFVDDGSGWPKAGQVYIDGFQYESLGGDTTVRGRCKWLNRMPPTQDGKPAFWPQPYEQLVKVLRTAGHEHDARRIAMAKQDAYRTHLRARAMCKVDGHYIPGEQHVLLRLWLLFAKFTVGYGYMPWRALYGIAAVIVLGACVFGYADNAHYMHVAKERVYMDADFKNSQTLPAQYPRFNALVFSIDTMIPFVDLHQENYWLPKSDGFWGGLLRLYFWLHIVSGWILATLAAAGLAGVIKKD